MNPKLLWGGVLLGIELMAKPSLNLVKVMLLVVVLDFITGIVKAKMKKVSRTSEGYRKSVVKVMQYLVPVIVLWAGGKYIPEYKDQLQSASGWLMMFIIYIEATSVFENLYEIDPVSPIAKYVYKPMLKVLKFGIEKNKVTAMAEKENETKNP